MQEDFFKKIFTSHLIARVRKGCSRFACKRELEIEHNCNILTPNLWPSPLCLSRSQMLNERSRGYSADGFLYGILSASSPDLNSSGPKGPFALMWLSLPHLPPIGCNSTGNSTRTRTLLSYIMFRRPLDLWNRMFNRHQAEITVMQFTGHSLPVHHSVVAQWDLHLVLYYQP